MHYQMSLQGPPPKAMSLLRESAIPFRNAAGPTKRYFLIALMMAFPAVLFYAYLGYSETGSIPLPGKNALGYVCSIVTGAAIGYSLYGVNRLLDERIPWMKYFTSRFLVGLIANMLIALALLTLLSSLAKYLFGNRVFWSSPDANDLDVQWKVSILTFVFIFIYNVIYTLLYSYQHYAVAQLGHLARERRLLELQFEALKRQISPHFLFNNLNTISSLIMKDLPSAEQFIRRLAQTYQYVLTTQDKKFVTLREELDFVESYYYLLRMRFQHQLHVEVNVPGRIMETKVPPLTLQMLVENAVKHNAFHGNDKLLVYITAQDNTWLKVINTKTASLKDVPSFNLGLENIRQRYKYLTEKPIHVENNEKFIVSLPVIHVNDETEARKNSA